MAVVNYTHAVTKKNGYQIHKVTWPAMANGDTGQPFTLPPAIHQSVQVAGTFGTGGTMKFKGSDDETNYLELTDKQGNAISKTAAAIENFDESPMIVRPEITAGDGATALAVTMVLKTTF